MSTPEEEETRRIQRERNKLASARYRKRRKLTNLMNEALDMEINLDNETSIEKIEELLHQSKSRTVFRICECKKELYSRAAYFRHKRKCSDSTCKGKFKCQEEGCNFISTFSNPFIQHLENVHGIDCMEEVKSFFNFSEFEKWKEEYEKETQSWFSLNSVKRTKHDERKYYCCHRSGEFSSASTGIRLMKAQGSVKIGYNCPAHLIVHSLFNSEHVSVNICHYHYGHDNQLAYMSIPKRDKDSIAQQLAQGLSPSQILENTFSGNDTKIQRKHLLTKKDLYNIAKTYNIGKIEKKSDISSVEVYAVEDLENEKSIMMHKKQGQNAFLIPKDQFCPLDKNDFVIGIMTDFQKEMLKKFGNNIVCLNVTHGKKSFKFSLITILVIDEYRERIPVAWLICSRENIVVLKLFFKIVKKEIGDIQPEILMSDKAPQYFNTWKEIFLGKTKKIICHWYVHQDWQRNINKLKNNILAMKIYEELCILLKEGDKAEFEIMLQNSCKQLKDNVETRDFYNFFKNEYLPIKEEWAQCFRLKLYMNTNLHWDSLRKLQKCGDVQKQGGGVEIYMVILLQFAKDLAIKQLIKLEKGKITWRSTEIKKRHKIAVELPFSLVNEVSPTIWEVKSEQGFSEEIPLSEDLIYDVKKEPACDKNCKIICQKCSICVHSYTCNCSDALDGNICKHVHLVNIYSKSQTPINKIKVFPINNISVEPREIKNNDDCIITRDAVLKKQNLILIKAVKSNTTELLKQKLLEDTLEMYNKIRNCDNQNSLLAVQQHINSAIQFLN